MFMAYLHNFLFTDKDDEPSPTFRRSSEGDSGDDDDLELKVIVPKGIVFAVRKNDPSTPVWKHRVSFAYWVSRLLFLWG